MNEKYINPFLQAFVNIMPQFGLTEISRRNVSLKGRSIKSPGVIVIIGIFGAVKGNVIYAMTEEDAKKVASAMMMGMPVNELDELAQSAISELVNMLTANVATNFSLEGIQIEDDVLNYIANISGNDLRFAYNLLEVAYSTSSNKTVDIDHIKRINSKPVFIHDKNEDGYYDVLSAFQKSIRGSDVDASLHYLARLIAAGDLDSIYRRMSVIAYEDIGLANPSIGPKVMAAIQASELVGLPEARIPLGTIVTEMALSPKSNTAHIALDKALADVETGRAGAVPDHIKTTSKDYKYPHDYPNAYVPQQYLPDNLKNKKYYIPKDKGYEQNIKYVYDKLESIKKTVS